MPFISGQSLVSAKGIGKKSPILRVGLHAPVPPTRPVNRVVLLHTDSFAEGLFDKYYLKILTQLTCPSPNFFVVCQGFLDHE